MSANSLGFFARLRMALRLLFNVELAAQVQESLALPAPEIEKNLPGPEAPQNTAPTSEGKHESAAPIGLKALDDDQNAASVTTEAQKETTKASKEAKTSKAKPEPKAEVAETIAEAAKAENFDSALQILALLQREGRLIDFLQEDVGSANDADVGAAARIVHAGCKKALKEYITIKPLRSEQEGDPVTLQPGFDPRAVRLTGKILGEPPFHGHVAHAGWRVTRIELPPLAEGQDAAIVAPAEIDL